MVPLFALLIGCMAPLNPSSMPLATPAPASGTLMVQQMQPEPVEPWVKVGVDSIEGSFLTRDRGPFLGIWAGMFNDGSGDVIPLGFGPVAGLPLVQTDPFEVSLVGSVMPIWVYGGLQVRVSPIYWASLFASAGGIGAVRLSSEEGSMTWSFEPRFVGSGLYGGSLAAQVAWPRGGPGLRASLDESVRAGGLHGRADGRTRSWSLGVVWEWADARRWKKKD